ncbi:MAG: FMN-binding protein [Propionibacteriaceae bacterium]|nr:FMN-binding protein [Propionibacteriaceae bacterium]
MRRITMIITSTIAAVVLLFSYRTSTNATAANPATAEDTTTPTSGSTAGTTVTPSATSSSTSSDSSSGSSSSGSASSSALNSGTFTGDAVTTRWGVVQVQITVADGTITAAKALQYPNENGKDQQINAYAIPLLNSEVTQAQSAEIDAVSGATVTSNGYLQSLQSAIDAAQQ